MSLSYPCFSWHPMLTTIFDLFDFWPALGSGSPVVVSDFPWFPLPACAGLVVMHNCSWSKHCRMSTDDPWTSITFRGWYQTLCAGDACVATRVMHNCLSTQRLCWGHPNTDLHWLRCDRPPQPLSPCCCCFPPPPPSACFHCCLRRTLELCLGPPLVALSAHSRAPR